MPLSSTPDPNRRLTHYKPPTIGAEHQEGFGVWNSFWSSYHPNNKPDRVHLENDGVGHSDLKK